MRDERPLPWVRGHSMCTRVRAQTLQHERQGKTLDYSPIEPMLVSSVQAVVACYVTAPRVCTLVLFNIAIMHTCTFMTS